VLQDMQLCGSFLMYSSLHIPIWDGGNCFMMEIVVWVFYIFGLFFTLLLLFGAAGARSLPVGVLALVLGVLLFPFTLYISIIAVLVYLIGVVIVLVNICCCGESLADEDGKGDVKSNNSLKQVKIEKVSKESMDIKP